MEHRVTEQEQEAERGAYGYRPRLFGFALSGLQDFLYDLSPETPSQQDRLLHGGRDTDAATRLRTRSAILTLVPGLVAWALKREDRSADIIYLGGGKLFARASQEAVKAIEPELTQLYDWLVKCSRGVLGAYWCAEEGSENQSDDIHRLLKKLSVAKWQAGRHQGWHSAAGKIDAYPSVNQLGDKNWEATEGAEFAKREFIGFHVGSGDWIVHPWKAKPIAKNDKPEIWLAGRNCPDGALQVAIPTHTPKFTKPVTVKDGEKVERFEPGDTIRLHLLAELDETDNPRTAGAPYLALLKLDGDNVGKLMDRALEADDDRTQYSTVSDKLTRFFGERVMQLLQEQFPRLYLVYSGGDDLVACGWFQDVLVAAKTVREAFLREEIGTTVSAGITFFTRSSPILRAIEGAIQQLDNAKDAGRDRISVGGCVMTWAEFDKTSAEVEALVCAVNAESINRGALQLLRHLGSPWLPDAPEAHAQRRWASVPMMHYMRSRREGRDGWKESEWHECIKDLFDSLQSDETDWPRAALVGTLAAWRTKKRQEEE